MDVVFGPHSDAVGFTDALERQCGVSVSSNQGRRVNDDFPHHRN